MSVPDDGHGPKYGCTYQSCGNPDTTEPCPFTKDAPTLIEERKFVDGPYWDYAAIRALHEAEVTVAYVQRHRKLRKPVRPKVRYELIAAHPYCTLCGATVPDGIRLEVDHIDGNPSNNHPSNLQVLCNLCNVGKVGRTNVA